MSTTPKALPTYRLDTGTIFHHEGYTSEPGTVAVKSYRDVLDAYRVQPEPKSLGPDARPCGRHTVGLLGRRLVVASSIAHVGKEANLLEEIAAGLVTAEADTLTTYGSRPLAQAPRFCVGCGTALAGKQQRWCRVCRADHRLQSRADRIVGT